MKKILKENSCARRPLVQTVLAIGLTLAGISAIHAADVFPNKPIQLVIPFAPGLKDKITG